MRKSEKKKYIWEEKLKRENQEREIEREIKKREEKINETEE